jgi:hypothetical protein
MYNEAIVNQLKVMGFELIEVGHCAYAFQYENIWMSYFNETDESCIRMTAPRIYDVTDDNREELLRIINKINGSINYTKITLWGDNVWVFYEHYLLDGENIEVIIEHIIEVLKATVYLFLLEVNGQDTDSIFEETEEDD